MKLHWNENLFGPLPGVLDAVRGDLDDAWMYPEEAYEAFRADVAAAHRDEPEPRRPGARHAVADRDARERAAPSRRRRGGARPDLLPVRAVLRRPRSPGSPGADARARDRPRRARRDRRSHPGEDRLGLRPEQPDRNRARRHRAGRRSSTPCRTGASRLRTRRTGTSSLPSGSRAGSATSRTVGRSSCCAASRSSSAWPGCASATRSPTRLSARTSRSSKSSSTSTARLSPPAAPVCEQDDAADAAAARDR